MLNCVSCRIDSIGAAWHWIAYLRPVPGGAECAFYCPSCAEREFNYFSRQRIRRRALTEESLDE
jgi:hypothetical protein